MVDSSAPFYQAGLRNRLCYELTFNNYNGVINSSIASPDAKYKITDISLEYEIVSQPTLTRSIAVEYDGMALLYDRVFRHRQIVVIKSDTTWNWSFNTPCKSLKRILVLFEKEKPYVRDTSKFYNPKIQKVSVILEGKPNQLYAQGMRSFEQYDEIRKYFAKGVQRDSNMNEVQAQLQLYDLSLGEYLVNKNALWLDFRMIDENTLHGMGREIENALEGITLQIEKKGESAGSLNAYIYLIMDARLNTALFVAPTGVGKMHLALNLLESEYKNHFDFIVIICPMLADNETYRSRGWVWTDPEVIHEEPGNQLYYLIEKYSKLLAGSKLYS